MNSHSGNILAYGSIRSFLVPVNKKKIKKKRNEQFTVCCLLQRYCLFLLVLFDWEETEIGLVYRKTTTISTLDRHGPNIQTIAIFLTHLISRDCYIYSAKCSPIVAPWFPEFSDLGPVIRYVCRGCVQVSSNNWFKYCNWTKPPYEYLHQWFAFRRAIVHKFLSKGAPKTIYNYQTSKTPANPTKQSCKYAWTKEL